MSKNLTWKVCRYGSSEPIGVVLATDWRSAWDKLRGGIGSHADSVLGRDTGAWTFTAYDALGHVVHVVNPSN